MSALKLQSVGAFHGAAESNLKFGRLESQDLTSLELDAFFWDCDGCLVDSEAIAMGDLGNCISSALVAAGHTAGLNDPNFVASRAGGHAGNIIQDIMRDKGVKLDSQAILKAHQYSVIEALKRDVRTFDGMCDLLSLLKTAVNNNIAVITSSESARVIPCLEKTNLLSYFTDEKITHVYSAPDICPLNKKPDPHIYLFGMKIFRAAPERTATVEDSVSGVRAASSAGVRDIIGFVGGSHYAHDRKDEFKQKLLDAGAHRVINDIREVPCALLDLQAARKTALKRAPIAGLTCAIR